MRYRAHTAISASLLLAASTLAIAGSSTAQPSTTDQKAGGDQAGSFAISGPEARDYALPGDVREVWSTTLPGGRTQTRYQQYVDGASVFGGQVTTITSASGDTAVSYTHLTLPTNREV